MNVALPTIASDLHASPASSIYGFVNAYQTAIVVSLLLFWAICSATVGSAISAVQEAHFTSLLCALSDFFLLTLARASRNFYGAALMSVNTALIRRPTRTAISARGMGINSFIVAVSSAAGPIAAAILSVACGSGCSP